MELQCPQEFVCPTGIPVYINVNRLIYIILIHVYVYILSSVMYHLNHVTFIRVGIDQMK